MIITVYSRSTAIVGNEVDYEVDDDYWNSLVIGEGMYHDEALELCISNNDASYVSTRTELIETIVVHESSVYES